MLAIITPIMRIIEVPMSALQRILGMKRIAWVFLAPNLILFGVFAFLPVILNMFYSVTGGDNVLLSARPNVGMRNFAAFADCGNFLDPNSCREDKFWRAIWNTSWFVTLQVGIMVAFSLLTAIILNRDIRARGFFRSVFFFPVLLSPVVVALIWKWILQREGVLNAFLDWTGIGGVNWLVGLYFGLGTYGVLHADPAGRAASNPARRLRGRDDGPCQPLAHLSPYHAALAGTDHAGCFRACLDQGRADLRRGLCLYRRWPRHRDNPDHPVYL